ncbi:hypothetical protein ABFU38_05475 [Xanthomonas campestris pv. raphani]|uniref:hypothetical protein n=1 Tax=Xanthomonas campestris TaxID=339 RepID=UPI00388DC9E7
MQVTTILAIPQEETCAAAAAIPPERKRHLYGPVLDFTLMGGGSVVVMLLLFLFWPQEWNTYELAAAMLLVANVVNHPHFAHSYQLFYSRFRSRALGRAFPLGLRVRYIFSGVVVPTVLVTFFAYCIWSGALNLIGYAANLMFFLVGWHYVKQGYGMLMLDAAFKRNFFSAAEKKFILWNCYVVWVTSWVLYNQIFSKGLYWNIKYAVFKIPHLIFQILAAATFLNFICLGLLFLRKYRNRKSGAIPVNGIVAYLTSAYPWLLVTSPVILLVIPAFHSLQYLAVVWRYSINRERLLRLSAKNRPFQSYGSWMRISLFILCGFILGYTGFWLVPELLERLFYSQSVSYGGTLYLFVCWIFINTHHFFLDNVIWRKDNPDTKLYLFDVA